MNVGTHDNSENRLTVIMIKNRKELDYGWKLGTVVRLDLKRASVFTTVTGSPSAEIDYGP